ncbi:arsenite methyltransferase [Thermosediminibacter oceani]|uniref:Arsenite methyltransferase n=1 Tax=Thermosediminibacter oceani (strain ATCC BAA-1034 / DSM 16646 / JW/IW-1228P) TaxID=555079 RepID=D9S1V3_THEOJ|nr:arsenite methyltransferase [Thermosediminibacter oceani]ADL07380.1 Arsenite methyltransferase [Thermosediminibacter oceani DSM 16646]
MEFNVKEKVKEYYSNIAKKAEKGSKSSCCSCGSSCCGDVDDITFYNEEDLKGLPEEAVNLSLGCANPIVLADLKEGETVLDLGSGGGIDVLIASKYVGDTGKVYGLDMTDEMLALANKNKEKMGVTNVEFIKGYIEDIPLGDETVDVIISNCVINLCEDKEKALKEAYRVLKKGGRLAIADIVALKDVPEDIKKQVELWAGCIAGTIKIEEYREILQKVGFKNIEIDPVHIYTKDIIKELLIDKKGIMELVKEIDLNSVDGAFAGAYIKAFK